MQRLMLSLLGFVLLAACASNPVLTGKPQDWKGKPAGDLRAVLGKPTRIITQTDGSEIWEYVNSGEFIAPQEENTSFRMGGGSGGGMFGASGGINTVTHGQRLSQYQNITRFQIRKGKVKGWYASRIVDGRVVWEDH